MKISKKERTVLVQEIAERLKDMVYMNGKERAQEVISEIIPNVDPANTDDKFTVNLSFNLVTGDIIQIIGRKRRQ